MRAREIGSRFRHTALAASLILLLTSCASIEQTYDQATCNIEEGEIRAARQAVEERMRTGDLSEARGGATLQALRQRAQDYREGNLTCPRFQKILDGYASNAPPA